MDNQYLKDRNLVEAIVLKALASGFEVNTYDEIGEHFQAITDIEDLRNSIDQLEVMDLVLVDSLTGNGHAFMLVNNRDSLISDYDCELSESKAFSELIEQYEA